jgi:hypothetical protein
VKRYGCILVYLAVLLVASVGRGGQGGVGLHDLLPTQDEFLGRETIDIDGRISIFTDWKRWSEEGRSLLSDIERTRFDAGIAIRLSGDCLISVETERWENEFDGIGQYDADGFGLHSEMRVLSDLQLDVGFITRDNDRREAPDTESYYAELSWSFSDEVVLFGSFERKDELYNFYGLLQGTQADVYTVRVKGGETFLYDLGAELKEYTDLNDTIRILASLAREFELGSGAMKASLGAEYRNARWKSYYLLAGGNLAGIIHPYWAPRDYAVAALGVDYRIDYGDGGKVALHAAATFDTEEDLGVDARLKWSHKYAFVEGVLYRSDEWDANGYGVGLQFSF